MKKKTIRHTTKASDRRNARVTSVTLEEVRARVARGEDRTDWAHVDALTDRDIERAIDADPDAAPRLGAEFWRNAQLLIQAVGAPKTTITLRVDTDVLNTLKQSGQGYQSRINAVLRAYVATLKAS
jgi:uncharacterized protein (DUF4415 family)